MPPVVADSETVVLSPFVVSADEDQGYSAKATLAGTRIRTELKDVGSSVSIVTKKFLEDTKSNKSEQLLVYTPSTEVAGQGGNFLGKGDGRYLTSSSTSVLPATRVRGLAAADNTRDFFLTDIPWDSYNTDRIDLQRGPNSILFGIGSPAGIINSSPNPASFRNSNKVESQFGSFGSMRFSADFNYVLLPHELAVRVSLLRDDTKYRQDPAFRDDHRIYAAAKWDPAYLNKGSSHTSLRASFEKGDIHSNMPRNTPPLDAISTWFNVLNRQVYDPNLVTLGMRSTAPGLEGVGGNTALAAVITVTPGGAQAHAYMGPNDDVPAALYYQPVGPSTYDRIARIGKMPGYTIDAWKAHSLTDPTVFDFYNNMLEGPNSFQFNHFTALNAALSQTFLNDKLGLEVSYDRQKVYAGGFNYLESALATAVSVDILTNQPFGVANPDVRRPMFASHGGYGQWSDTNREVWRATAFGDLNFADISGKDSTLNRIFGRNTFTGLATRQENKSTFASYKGYHTEQPFISLDQNSDIHTADFYTDDLFFYNYLGAPIAASATSAAGLNLQGLKGQVMPHATTISAYNYQLSAPLASRSPFVTTIGLPVTDNVSAPDSAKKYRGASKSVDRVDSTAFVWQGYWLDGTVIPMIGYRTDEQTFRSAGNAPTYGALDQYKDIYSPDWKLEDVGNSTKVHSKTYSLVTHLPEKMRQKLPGHMDVSLIYNQSENVQPGAGRRDVEGNAVPDPAGKTKEYGFAISGFNDKVSLKVVHYDTTVKNATVGDSLATEYWYLGFVDGWGQWAAYATRDHAGDPNWYQSSRIYGYSSTGKAVTWLPDGTPKASYSQAELDATYAKQKAAVDDWFKPENQLSDAVIKNWNLLHYKDPTYYGWPGGDIPGGLQVTGDTVSKGYEIELVANPLKGLNVSFNASKTNARRTNLASSYVDFIEKRWKVFQGPAGDIRYWGTSTPALGELPAVDDRDDPVNGIAHGGDGWTARGQFRRAVMSGYWLYRALQNADVPELKPWNFNVVGDYAFQSGLLKGANVGGSYRWASANVTGFPVVVGSDGVESYDVTKPYKGSPEGATDLWIGYARNINKKFKWRTQLNVRNVFSRDELIRVTVNPDGNPAGYRIPEPRTFTWTNTIEF